LVAGGFASDGFALRAAEKNDRLRSRTTLSIARPSETITIPWTEVAVAMPGALLQKIAVKDSAGRSLPYQVTNVAPEAKDPLDKGRGVRDLIFQHDSRPGKNPRRSRSRRSIPSRRCFRARFFARFHP